MQTTLIYGGDKEIRTNKAYEIMQALDASFSSNLLFRLKLEEGKSNISIEQSRSLMSFISLKPVGSKYKFALIDEAQYLSLEAQNALLKVLEEPPTYALVVLTIDT